MMVELQSFMRPLTCVSNVMSACGSDVLNNSISAAGYITTEL